MADFDFRRLHINTNPKAEPQPRWKQVPTTPPTTHRLTGQTHPPQSQLPGTSHTDCNEDAPFPWVLIITTVVIMFLFWFRGQPAPTNLFLYSFWESTQNRDYYFWELGILCVVWPVGIVAWKHRDRIRMTLNPKAKKLPRWQEIWCIVNGILFSIFTLSGWIATMNRP